MRIAVVGVGGLAEEVVRQASGHGHDVVAFGERSGGSDGRVNRVPGNGLDFEEVRAALRGAEAVIAVLDAANEPTKRIGTVIHAMAELGAWKLAVVSAAGAFARDDRGLPFAERLKMRTILRGRYDELEDTERRVMASDLGWTIVRPAAMTDGPFTGTYRFTRDGSIPSKARPVARADVAAALLKAVETDLWNRKTVTVAN